MSITIRKILHFFNKLRDIKKTFKKVTHFTPLHPTQRVVKITFKQFHQIFLVHPAINLELFQVADVRFFKFPESDSLSEKQIKEMI